MINISTGIKIYSKFCLILIFSMWNK